MRSAALAVLALFCPLAQADDVDALFAKMHAAYQKVHSADITIQVQIGKEAKHVTEICHVLFVAPNLLHETLTDKSRSPGLPSSGGFTYISDGKRLQTIGRSKVMGGGNGIKPFSAASVQDDGVPVYKEALSFWDWKRQWSGEKGGKSSGHQYNINPNAKWEGKQYIGLAEISPDHREAFHYMIDPKTYLIMASIWFVPNEQGTDWQVIGIYDVKKLSLNPKIDRSVFTIRG